MMPPSAGPMRRERFGEEVIEGGEFGLEDLDESRVVGEAVTSDAGEDLEDASGAWRGASPQFGVAGRGSDGQADLVARGDPATLHDPGVDAEAGSGTQPFQG